MNILGTLSVPGIQRRIWQLEKWRREASVRLERRNQIVSLVATPERRAQERVHADFWRNVEGRLHFQVRQARAELRRRMN